MASIVASPEYTPFKRFLRLLEPDRQEIGYIYLYAVLIGLISLAGPLGVQAIINLIAGGEFNVSLVVLALIVTLAAGFVGVLKIMQTVIAETLQRRLFTRAALEFAYRLPRIRIDALRESYPPELVNRFFDTVNVQKGLPKILLDFSAAVMQILFGIILVTFYNTFFGILGLIFVSGVVLLLWTVARRSLTTSLAESKYKYRVAGWLEDMARANNTFKLAGGARLGLRRTDELVSGYLTNRSAHFRYLLWHYGGFIVMQALATLAFLLLGGYLVIENEINIGQFVAAELVILTIVSNAEKIIYTFETVYDTLTGVEKIAAVTDLPLESGGSMDFRAVDSGRGIHVEATNLTFAYDEGATPALDGIDLNISPGQLYCVAGFNRAGRTTLMQLLAGLRLDFTGQLLYNGTPLKNFALDTVRQVIGDYTSQEEIIHANVVDNICLGHADVSFADIQWAVQQSGLKDWVAEQPDGYETVLVAEGLDIPRSVRVRLLIARALVRRPRLLVVGGLLEELEPALRAFIVDNLTAESRTWTLIIASNDPRVARRCDRAGVMRQGRIIAEGPAGEVLRKRDVAGVWVGTPDEQLG